MASIQVQPKNGNRILGPVGGPADLASSCSDCVDSALCLATQPRAGRPSPDST